MRAEGNSLSDERARKLEELHALLRTQRKARMQDVAELSEDVAELRTDGAHAPDDVAARETEYELAEAHASTVWRSLREIDDALRRFDDGTYGTCGRCGASIPTERLEVLPHTRYCTPCQSQVRKAQR